MSMNLFLMCHGIVSETDNADENLRVLAHRGHKRCEKVARNLGKLGISFDLILFSPYVYVHQTAEIVADRLEIKPHRLIETINLLPSSQAGSSLVDEINTHTQAKNFLLVGHEPDLVGLLSMLLTGSEGVQIQLKKAGVCKLSTPQLIYGRCAMLEWLMTPTQLIAI